MSFKFAVTAAAILLSAGLASAQTNQPAARPGSTAPAAPAAAPKTTAPAPAAKAEPLVNLNTAKADELDKLPQIGEKRAADIIAKRPYKDWNDFVAKNVVPSNAEAAIKDKVKFR